MIALAVMVGIFLGILLDIWRQPVIYEAEAHEEPSVVAQEVRIEVVIDWTEERIIKEIRDVFPEDPDVAVAVAKCESGLVKDIQSRHMLSYGREVSWGLFQIHERDHAKTAVRIGAENYKTDPADNIALARYIYDQRLANGGYAWQDWSCYKNGGYKEFM